MSSSTAETGANADATTASDAASARRRPSLVLNAFTNWSALGVNMLAGLVLTPFIIAYIGKGGYGVWTLVGSIIGYYGVLDLGISSAIGRYVAFHAGQGDRRALNETVSTAFALFTVIGLLILILAVASAGFLARFFEVSEGNVQTFKVLIWIMGVGLAVEFPGRVFRATVRAHEHFLHSNIAVIVATLARVGLTVYLLLSGWGLLGVAVAYLATDIVGILGHVVLCRRLIPDVRIRPSFVQKATVRTLMTFGGATMVITIADTVRFNLDSVVIGRYLDMEAVGVYGIAAVLIRYLLRGVVAGMVVMAPRFSRLVGESDHAALRDLLLRSMWISAVVSSLACLGLIVFGRALITAWVGSGFSGAVPVLILLATSFAFAMSQAPTVPALYALYKHRFYAFITVAEAVLNLGLSLVLVHDYGIVGVALGTCIPMLIVKVIVQPVYLTRCLPISLGAYYLRLVPATVVFVVTAWLLRLGWA